MTQATPLILPLNETDKQRIVDESIDYAIAHGIVMKKDNTFTATPFALTPSPVPKNLFAMAKQTAPYFQKMKHNLVQDIEFLKESLKNAAAEDEFTNKLLQVLEESQQIGIVQPISLSISRCDYMLHQENDDPLKFQQVEMNMISCSFSNLGPKLAKLHRFMLTTDPLLKTMFKEENHLLSEADELVPQSLADAFELYNNKNAVIVMVVQPGEKNAFDQRFFEYWLKKNKGIVMRRYSLKQIYELSKIDSNKKLTINNEEIAVAYFRAGYTPKDYPSETEWKSRVLLETSMVIKCPTVALQLSGLKKIQQVLSNEKVMKKFVENEQELNEMKLLMADLWSLGDSNDNEIVQKAIETNCFSFVLKPQREGGGNNYYDEQATHLLKTLSVAQRRAYILMSRIHTPTHKTLAVRNEQCEEINGVSELGIYGSLLANGAEIVHNRDCGYLLRTKSVLHKDGGVAAGVAMLDSIYLTE